MGWLGLIDLPAGVTARNRAEATAASAYITQYHDRCGAFSPALADVGATRFFTHGVESKTPKCLGKLGVPLAAGHADFQPLRFALM
jgi:hypothetical protein